MLQAGESQGGRGNATARDHVLSLRRRGFDDAMIRQQLKAEGKLPSNISKLMKYLKQWEQSANVLAAPTPAAASSHNQLDLMDASLQELEG